MPSTASPSTAPGARCWRTSPSSSVPSASWLYDDFGFKDGIEGFEQFDATFQLRGGWELNGHLAAGLREVPGQHLRGLHRRRRRRARLSARQTTSPDSSGPPRSPRRPGRSWARRCRTRRGRVPIFQEGADGGRAAAHRARWSCGPSPTIRVAATRHGLPARSGWTAASSRGRSSPGSRSSTSPTGRSSSGRSGSTAPSGGRRCSIPSPATRSSSGERPSRRRAYNGLRVDLLASFEPTPGTVAFLGYGSSLRDGRRVQLVPAGAGERRVLRQAGVSNEALKGAYISVCLCPDFHPVVARWFAERLGEPTAAQRQGWEAIRAGRHTLISAPTGSGKTLAAFLYRAGPAAAREPRRGPAGRDPGRSTSRRSRR